MKTYRVKGYETVMYYVDIKAQNKHDAYTKAMDVNVLDWEQEQDKNRTDLNIKVVNTAIIIPIIPKMLPILEDSG